VIRKQPEKLQYVSAVSWIGELYYLRKYSHPTFQYLLYGNSPSAPTALRRAKFFTPYLLLLHPLFLSGSFYQIP
jgi:hypothetical protein